MPTEQLGKYTLLQKIAVGGMAEIYLAEQSGPVGFKKRLVIKRILPHLVGDKKFLQMFQDEARLAAMMNHPNIVQIFDLGQEENNSYYIAMEYVPGYNLRALIQHSDRRGVWLAPEYIAKLASQICEGLEYAHNFCNSDGTHLNLIHRDVSPQNIILSEQGIVKIVDFGIAKAQSNVEETQAGIIKGKLAYMSPEQVKGEKLDRRSDLFSLGIVMYELATHQRPFHGKSDIDMLRSILEHKPEPIQNLRSDFPRQLSDIIFKALAKNRDERYQSARELQWDLERFLQEWGKPIGPFQLQELLRRIKELDDPKSSSEAAPSVPSPTPQPVQPPSPPPAAAPPPPPPTPSLPTPQQQQGYQQNYQQGYQQNYQQGYQQNYQQGYQQNYQQGYQQNYQQGYQQGYQDSQWGATPQQSWETDPSLSNDWEDDDGDATILSFPPNSSNFQMSPPADEAEDLDTFALSENEDSAPSAATILDSEGVAPVVAQNYQYSSNNNSSSSYSRSSSSQENSNKKTTAVPPPNFPPPAKKSDELEFLQPQKKKSKTVLYISFFIFLIVATLGGLYFFVFK